MTYRDVPARVTLGGIRLAPAQFGDGAEAIVELDFHYHGHGEPIGPHARVVVPVACPEDAPARDIAHSALDAIRVLLGKLAADDPERLHALLDAGIAPPRKAG